jgi:hypothetical protein
MNFSQLKNGNAIKIVRDDEGNAGADINLSITVNRAIDKFWEKRGIHQAPTPSFFNNYNKPKPDVEEQCNHD